MILPAGKTFGVVTRMKSIGVAIGLTNYAHSLGKAGSHSFLQRMMNFITTLSF